MPQIYSLNFPWTLQFEGQCNPLFFWEMSSDNNFPLSDLQIIFNQLFFRWNPSAAGGQARCWLTGNRKQTLGYPKAKIKFPKIINKKRIFPSQVKKNKTKAFLIKINKNKILTEESSIDVNQWIHYWKVPYSQSESKW